MLPSTGPVCCIGGFRAVRPLTVHWAAWPVFVVLVADQTG